MALPQGIPFRSTEAYVSDSGNDDSENSTSNTADAPVDAISYPRTTTQGNSVGWEVIDGGTAISTRNRNTAGGRLAGHHAHAASAVAERFRIDLPSAGSYLIRLAAGDYNYSSNTNATVYDDTTSVVSVTTATTAATRWRDATGVERTSVSDWNNNNAGSTQTFASTILRMSIGTGAANGQIAYLYVESAAAATVNLGAISGAAHPGRGPGIARYGLRAFPGGITASAAAVTTEADFSSTSVVTLTGVGASTASAAFSSTSAATLTGAGAATAAAVFSSTSAATLTGDSRELHVAAFDSDSVATLTGVSASVAAAAFSSASVATITGDSAATAAAAFSSTSTLTLIGEGSASSAGAGDGYITVTLTLTGAGASSVDVAGYIALTATLIGAGASVVAAAGYISMALDMIGASESSEVSEVIAEGRRRRRNRIQEIDESDWATLLPVLGAIRPLADSVSRRILH